MFKSCKWKNFLSTGDAFTEIKLNKSPTTLIVGQNGTGKTNLLDALHYLSFTKSAFTMTDNQTIKQGAQFFLIKGTFEKGGNTDQVICYQELRKKKNYQAQWESI